MADAFSALSHGSLQRLTVGEIPERPILQCVQIKAMASQAGNERYRIVMNDSVNFIQGMLGTRKSTGVSSLNLTTRN